MTLLVYRTGGDNKLSNPSPRPFYPPRGATLSTTTAYAIHVIITNNLYNIFTMHI